MTIVQRAVISIVPQTIPNSNHTWKGELGLINSGNLPIFFATQIKFSWLTKNDTTAITAKIFVNMIGTFFFSHMIKNQRMENKVTAAIILGLCHVINLLNFSVAKIKFSLPINKNVVAMAHKNVNTPSNFFINALLNFLA